MLKAKVVAKNFPKSPETQKGHMMQQQQGVQSMQEKEDKDDKNIFHVPQPRSKEISVNIDDIKNIMCIKQTGKLLVVSSQENIYIMVLYKKDENHPCQANKNYNVWRNVQGMQ